MCVCVLWATRAEKCLSLSFESLGSVDLLQCVCVFAASEGRHRTITSMIFPLLDIELLLLSLVFRSSYV